ncbi:hypothetical protein V8E51_007804 [Hyaloscypha variabilis]
MVISNYWKVLCILVLLLRFQTSEAHGPEHSGAPSTLNRDCSCGFYDRTSKHLFTDSLIVYFNETTSFPYEAFTISNYTHK